MAARLHNDQVIDELVHLAGVSTLNPTARRWMVHALPAGQAIAAGKGQPSLAEQNAPLHTVRLATHRSIIALNDLKRHPHAHKRFWSAFRANKVDDVDVMSVLTTVRQAADDARVRRIGRRPKLRKQHIVNLALAFCARFSPATPSSDENNFFRPFAERFFEYATGLPPEKKGHGIVRQIRVALQRLPIETERGAHLNETRAR